MPRLIVVQISSTVHRLTHKYSNYSTPDNTISYSVGRLYYLNCGKSRNRCCNSKQKSTRYYKDISRLNMEAKTINRARTRLYYESMHLFSAALFIVLTPYSERWNSFLKELFKFTANNSRPNTAFFLIHCLPLEHSMPSRCNIITSFGCQQDLTPA